MPKVTRKTEIAPIDGTPDKRMFWSIISDYDLKTGICELIDNALDLWMSYKPRPELRIVILLDADRQLVFIKDNAGGVEQEDLHLLVAPGGSKNDPEAETIGIFGVGNKRAVVALGEHVVIKTRHGTGRAFEIEITKDWLSSPEWELAAYEIPELEAGTTEIIVSHLRKPFSRADLEELLAHLGETYAWFLKQKGCNIELNGLKVKPHGFENWTFPPGFEWRLFLL